MADSGRRRDVGVADVFGRSDIAHVPRGSRDFPIPVGAIVKWTCAHVALDIMRLPRVVPVILIGFLRTPNQRGPEPNQVTWLVRIARRAESIAVAPDGSILATSFTILSLGIRAVLDRAVAPMPGDCIPDPLLPPSDRIVGSRPGNRTAGDLAREFRNGPNDKRLSLVYPHGLFFGGPEILGRLIPLSRKS